MADPDSAPGTSPGKPVRPSWKQIGLLLFAGIILVPGLCFGIVFGSSAFGSGTVMDNAGSVVVTLLIASILLTLGGGLLAVIRIIKDIRRR